MDISNAVRLLKCHAFAHDDVDLPKAENGFLGCLRPFQGELKEANLHEMMVVIRALAAKLGEPALDREIISCLWTICKLGRAWAVEPEGMLRSNGLITDEQVERMENWLDLISYAVMTLLDNGGEEEAFWGYHEYVSEQLEPLMAELDDLLQEKVVEAEIQELHGEYKERVGADEERLAAFERKFDVLLPEDFRSFYRRKDGSGYAFHILYPGDAETEECVPYYLMSLDEMEKTKGYFCERDELLAQYYSEEEIQELAPEIKPYLFYRKWFPFATMAGGSLYLMLDLDPSDQGTYGQIISYVHDPDFVYYVAGSFTDLLRESNRNLSLMDEIEY
ncbi:SMI1/KNR4 family protein [Paenibacillus sp. D2_2]|uniref:SMI1/KNR4 family protein n=1 Tax=Paenibacillus sp. D2_2 TaxID=3073092 RepID=UPI00281580FA|nr:SMI1/KNR4 family protein [Paenibacillus sp. D2_2]WMT41859.1 SMI1/KNR4 family protein [Paenibacillus sp. D2_2]